VFCLGCGAETPLHASTCAVCGRAIAGQVRRTASCRRSASHTAQRTSARRVSSPESGLPRDTPGRLAAPHRVGDGARSCCAWSVMYGEHLPLARLGPLAVALAALIALAGAPLVGESIA